MFLIPANSWLDVYRTTHQLVVYRCGAHTFHFHENPRSVFELSFGNSANTIWIANFVLFCGRLTFSVPWRRQNKNRATGRVQLHVRKKKIVFCFVFFFVFFLFGYRDRMAWEEDEEERNKEDDYTQEKRKFANISAANFSFFLSFSFVIRLTRKIIRRGPIFISRENIRRLFILPDTHTHRGAHERWWRVLAVIN